MADKTSNLIIRLQDMVSGPAKGVAASLKRIKTSIKGVDGLRGGAALDGMIARNEKQVTRLRSKLVDAGIAAYALKRALGAPITAAIEFESAMADVKKVVGAFEDKALFGQFQEDLKGLSRVVPRTVAELSQIAAAAGQAGLPHDEIVEFTKQVAQIATAFELSTEKTGTTLARLKSALNLSIGDVVLLADHMNVLANNMATSEGEVLEIVRRVGALAAKTGIATKNVAALGAAMNSSGVDAEVAGTAIRNMLLNTVGNVTKDAAKAMSKLGIDPKKFKTEVADKGVAAFRDLFGRINKLKNEDQAGVLQSIFGKRAVDALGPLMNNLGNLDNALALVASDAKNAGAAQKEFEVRSETLSSKLIMFNNRVSELSINVGNALIPALTQIAETVGPIVSSFAEWASQNQELVVKIVAITAGLVALKVAAIGFGYIGAIVKGSVLGISKVITSVLPILGKLRTAFMFTGVGAVITLIAAAGTKIYNNWEGLTTFFSAFGEKVAAAFAPLDPIIQPIIGLFGSVVEAISGMLGPLDASTADWQRWGDAAGDAVASAIKFIIALPGNIADTAVSAGTALLDMVTSFQKFGHDIGFSIGEGIASITSELVAFGQSVGTTISGGLTTAIDDMMQAGTDIGTALWEGLKSVFSSLVGWVSAQAAAILAPITGIASKVSAAFSSVGSFFGGGASTGPTGARAKGGPVSRGGSYLVGEKQPEIFTPGRSGSIAPSAAGASANVNFSPSFSFSGVAPGQADEITAKVRKVMQDEVREAFRGIMADTGIRFA